MNSDALLLIETIGAVLADHVQQARQRLTLAAPFVKRKALERLLAGLNPTVALTLFTRWSVDEVVAGVSDLSVLDFVHERSGSRLLLHPRLHAKVLLIDDHVAAIGSANVTNVALGFVEPANAEVMVLLQPVPNRLFQFLRHLERSAVLATEELRQRFEEAVKAAPPSWTPPVVSIGGESTRGPSTPFPNFRNPEQLYRCYLSVAELSDPDSRTAVLDELEVLSLPDGLDEAAFRQRVGAILLAREFVAAFDKFVAQPRYFGEMADWLLAQGILPDHNAEEQKRYLQTLIRWLRHFLPGRYRLEEPNYSELFGRVEGWDRNSG